MENKNWLEIMNHQQWLKQTMQTNQYTEKYGLALSEEDAEILIAEKNHILMHIM